MEQPVTRASLGEDARCVASAARDLVRAIENVGDVEEAVDALEACARRAVDVTVHGFDTGEAGEPDPEEMLGVALTQLEIGNTLLAAQHALTAPGKALRLDSAATSLEDAAAMCDVSLDARGTGSEVRLDCPFGCPGDHSGRREIAAACLHCRLPLSFIPDFGPDKSHPSRGDIAPSPKSPTVVDRQKPRRSRLEQWKLHLALSQHVVFREDSLNSFLSSHPVCQRGVLL